MVFRTRNCYYLRISEKTVLPLYVSASALQMARGLLVVMKRSRRLTGHYPWRQQLYLDERHLDWMSDVVLQHVLSDLRPRILPKLQSEPDFQSSSASAKSMKTSTVDTHRGASYQFCYFIRNVEPHSVLVKNRTYEAAPPRPKAVKLHEPAPKPPAAPKPKPRPKRAATAKKRKAAAAPPPKKKKKPRTITKKEKGKSSADAMDVGTSSEGEDIYVSSESEDDDEDEYMEEDEDPIEVDTPEDEQPTEQATASFDLEIEEEEEKAKPLLHLKYRGFTIYGKSLCVVVEPWPLPPKEPKTINTALGAQEGLSRLSMTPAPQPQRPAPSVLQSAASSSRIRGETPLFLPDEDSDDDSHGLLLTKPSSTGRLLPTLYTMEPEEESDPENDDPFKGMMAFTQTLKNAGDNRPSAAQDDEDMDSAALFGDADEVREL